MFMLLFKKYYIWKKFSLLVVKLCFWFSVRFFWLKGDIGFYVYICGGCWFF